MNPVRNIIEAKQESKISNGVNLSKEKILGLISFVGFLAIVYAIAHCLSSFESDLSALRRLVTPLFFSLNLIVLLSWISLGDVLSIIILSLSSIFLLFISLRGRINELNTEILIYVATSGIAFFFLKKMREFKRIGELEKEDLTEKMNVLFAEYQQHRSMTPALEKRLQRYDRLKLVTQTLSSTFQIEDIANLIVRETVELIGKSQIGILYLVDEEKQELSLLASIQQNNQAKATIRLKKGDIFDQWVLRQAKPLMVGNVRKDFRFKPEEIEEVRRFESLISAPLISENKVLGVLHLDSPIEENYTLDDLRLLGILSDLVAVAIKNGFLYQRTIELAIRDGLTGLFVHRYLLERLQEELARAMRSGSSCSVLMLDIDHFKDYNDRYGHVVGDIVLKVIANLLRGLVSAGDIVARFGGEEFVVILPNINKEEAKKMAELIRQRIESKKIVLRREETKITVSVGVVSFPIDAKSKEELIRSADLAMYKAKEEGRNRVCIL